MASAHLSALTLTDFRSYETASIALRPGAVALYGPNGAGKTNLLEAVSYLAPGRGLRGSAAQEVGRRRPGEAVGRPWAIMAVRSDAEGAARIGTGIETPAGRRLVRIDGEPVPPARLAEQVRLVWLTPQQDRLFLEAASERRRFLDRLTFADRPTHAVHAATYERLMRERLRLLTQAAAGGSPDPVWLDALEQQAGAAGAALAEGRVATLSALQAEIDTRGGRPFPLARLSLSGEWGSVVEPGAVTAALRRSRDRDAAAGRSLAGPGRTDLVVVHVEKDRPAAECSTGEQKALLLNIVLAQAARLARQDDRPAPILLLDEVAAHLDESRRRALYAELLALDIQAFLTGTDRALFEPLTGAAQHLRVEASTLHPED